MGTRYYGSVCNFFSVMKDNEIKAYIHVNRQDIDLGVAHELGLYQSLDDSKVYPLLERDQPTTKLSFVSYEEFAPVILTQFIKERNHFYKVQKSLEMSFQIKTQNGLLAVLIDVKGWLDIKHIMQNCNRAISVMMHCDNIRFFDEKEITNMYNKYVLEKNYEDAYELLIQFQNIHIFATKERIAELHRLCYHKCRDVAFKIKKVLMA